MKGLRQTRWQIFFMGMTLTCVVAALFFWRPSLLQGADDYVLDFLIRRAQTSPVQAEPVVIVDIDEASLQEFGQWPWPRGLLAELLEEISQAEPKAVGLDFLFAEPDRQGGDELLRTILSGGPFVLGIKFNFPNQRSSVESVPSQPKIPSGLPLPFLQGLGEGLFHASGVTSNIPQLTDAVDRVGFLNATPDEDGVLRRIPLLIRHGQAVYPSLALAVFLQSQSDQNLGLQGGTLGLDHLLVGQTRIPLDRQGQMRINFSAGMQALQWISAADLLHGTNETSQLAGRIVLVGTTAAGLDSRLATPLGHTISGVAVHGLVLANLQQGTFLQRPAYWRGGEVVGILVLGGILSLLLMYLPLLVGVATTVVLMFALWQGSAWLLHEAGVVISPMPAMLLAILLVPATILLHFLAEEKKASLNGERSDRMQNFMTHSLTALTAIRDSETGDHIHRTQQYLRVLCEQIGHHSQFSKSLPPAKIRRIVELAPLHDIGKVAVPDRLLRKPGRLNVEEYEEIKRHTIYGRQAIDDAQRQVGDLPPDETLQLAKEIVYSHHEWWDGSGYPEGLRGEAIPLAGRLMAVVDVYDALVSPRIYKGAVSHQAAMTIIRQGAGVQFDPEIVAVLQECESIWQQMTQEFSTRSIP